MRNASSVVALVIDFRDPDVTAQCIRSLLSQVISVVVIDNSDDAGASMRRLQTLFVAEPKVLFFDCGTNLGFAGGMNLGVRICNQLFPGSWVLLMNNDALAPRNLVEKLIVPLKEDDAALISFPALLHAGKQINRVFYHRISGAILSTHVLGSFEVPRGCCMLFASERFRDHLFDERFFMYGEEIELGWRLRSRPGALCFISDVAVVHEGSRSTKAGSQFYEERTAAAHLLLADITGQSLMQRQLLLTSRLFILPIRAALRSLTRASLAPIRGLFGALKIWRSARR